MKKAKTPKKTDIVSDLINYFAEDHGLHTFFTFVIIILLVIFGIVVYVFYSR